MNVNSYYMLAKNDYLYLQGGKNTGLNNNIAVQSQQVGDCLTLVEEVKNKVEDYLNKYGYCINCGAKLLKTGNCANCEK